MSSPIRSIGRVPESLHGGGEKRRIDLAGQGPVTIRSRSPVLMGADADRIIAAAEALRSALAEACAEANLPGSLTGWPTSMALRFEAQDGVEPETIRGAFIQELGKRGVIAGPTLSIVSELDDEEVRIAVQAIHDAVGAVRGRLGELGLYHSGGLPFVFPNADERLAERGLAGHRQPSGRVDFTMEPGSFRIAFRPGEFPEDVDAGFYAPTLLEGDFTVTARYRLESWGPGNGNARLRLFAHDMASGGSWMAELGAENGGLGDGAEGELKIERRGNELSSWRRQGGEWASLAKQATDDGPPVFVGAKVVCEGATESLEVELLDLRVEGTVAGEQPPVPEQRPDPRTVDPPTAQGPP